MFRSIVAMPVILGGQYLNKFVQVNNPVVVFVNFHYQAINLRWREVGEV